MKITNKYKLKEDITNRKPLIWLNNYSITEAFQNKTKKEYIKDNKIYINIWNRSLFEEPK